MGLLEQFLLMVLQSLYNVIPLLKEAYYLWKRCNYSIPEEIPKNPSNPNK